MLNILVPIGGKSAFFDKQEYQFPKPLIEINSRPMIEWVVENLNTISEQKKFIFVVNEDECVKYHLDNVLKLLDKDCQIIRLKNETKGAVCSALLAIDFINNTDRLLISNGDQIILDDMNAVLEKFKARDVDAGVICFDSVHPKWSYAKIDANNKIIETAEKNPISKNAIAGWYYFKQGRDFVTSAMHSIEKDAHTNGSFFIAPTLNEMVLRNKDLEICTIKKENYHSFYSPQKIKEFEKII